MGVGISLSSGNNLVMAGTTNLESINGSVTSTGGSAATLALHDCAAVADIAAGNLVHTLTLPRESGSTVAISNNFESLFFVKGLCAVLTLNSNTVDVLMEVD